MKIIIVGAGEIGTELAKMLANDEHDVVVLEKDAKKVANLANTLDVMVLEENGARITALEHAGIRDADVLIAATNTDEINIMSCMVAKKLSGVKTVARIRSSEYNDRGLFFSNQQLGIDIMINPEELTAIEIAKLVKTPAANDIEYFADGKIQLFVFRVDKDSEIVGKPINTLSTSQNFLIIAILRENGDVIIPRGGDRILPNDNIYVVGRTGVLSEIAWITRSKVKRPKNVMILGGGKIGFAVAKILEDTKNANMSVKLIEKSEEKCREISENLSKTLVINGNATDLTLLKEENLENIDVLISVTGNDEINILTSLLAKKLGVKKTIVEISRPDYQFVTQALEIDSFVSPRLIVASKLAKLFRKSNVVAVTILREGKAEMLELIASEGSPVLNIALKDLRLPKGVIIGGILRGQEVLIPRGNDMILPDDHVIVFTYPELVYTVERLFTSRRSQAHEGVTAV